jgi:hypothetical protein
MDRLLAVGANATVLWTARAEAGAAVLAHDGARTDLLLAERALGRLDIVRGHASGPPHFAPVRTTLSGIMSSVSRRAASKGSAALLGTGVAVPRRRTHERRRRAEFGSAQLSRAELVQLVPLPGVEAVANTPCERLSEPNEVEMWSPTIRPSLVVAVHVEGIPLASVYGVLHVLPPLLEETYPTPSCVLPEA